MSVEKSFASFNSSHNELHKLLGGVPSSEISTALSPLGEVGIRKEGEGEPKSGGGGATLHPSSIDTPPPPRFQLHAVPMFGPRAVAGKSELCAEKWGPGNTECVSSEGPTDHSLVQRSHLQVKKLFVPQPARDIVQGLQWPLRPYFTQAPDKDWERLTL